MYNHIKACQLKDNPRKMFWRLLILSASIKSETNPESKALVNDEIFFKNQRKNSFLQVTWPWYHLP